MTSDRLEKELTTYENLRPTFAGQEGNWVVITGEEVLGIFEDYPVALQTGYAACGLDKPFLVKQIETPGTALLVTRMLA